jgi:hypothetical protein
MRVADKTKSEMTMPKKKSLLPMEKVPYLSPKEKIGHNKTVPLADRLSLSPEEASALTGIGVTRIREAAGDCILVARKHGTRTIILPDDLKAWLNAMPTIEQNKSRPE